MTNLSISFTPNYFVPAAVTLKSIYDSSPQRLFRVHCLVTEDIPQHQRDLLQEMCGDRMTFEYINLRGRLNGYYIDPRYSEAASYRLLLPELLPELNSVVYVDCDIVVRQDLAIIDARTILKDKLIAAVYEAPIENQSERWEAIGCNPGRYFNSGFLIMNLAQMRKENTSEKLLEVLRRDYLEFPDQDALNIVCKGRVFALSPDCNAIRTFFLPQYDAEFRKQYGEGQTIVKDGSNIHYTGGKPWDVFTVRFADWWSIYDSLPRGIREQWTPNVRILRLWKLYRTRVGRRAVDTARALRRKLKRH